MSGSEDNTMPTFLILKKNPGVNLDIAFANAVASVTGSSVRVPKTRTVKTRTVKTHATQRRVSYKSPRALVTVRKQSSRLSSTRNTKKQAYADYKKMVLFVKEKFNKPLGKAYWHKDWSAFHKIKKARAPYLKMLKDLKNRYLKASTYTRKENWKLRRAQVERQISIHGEEGYRKKRLAKAEARAMARTVDMMDNLIARGISPEKAAIRATIMGGGFMNLSKLQAMERAGVV